LWMHGEGMAEGTHMMWGGPMMTFGLLYFIGVILFFWLMFRGVIALEEIAENTEDSSDN
jgi:hypothetical protein